MKKILNKNMESMHGKMLSEEQISKAFEMLGVDTPEKRDALLSKWDNIDSKSPSVKDINITDNTYTPEEPDANMG